APAQGAATTIVVVAHDLDQHLLPGITFTYGGVTSLPTDAAGATELDLPDGHPPGRLIDLDIVEPAPPAKSRKTTAIQDWMLVNRSVNIPSPSEVVHAFLMHRSTLRLISDEVRDASVTRAHRPGASPAEGQKAALAEAARS